MVAIANNGGVGSTAPIAAAETLSNDVTIVLQGRVGSGGTLSIDYYEILLSS
jgi:hypothetical protein